LHRDPGVDREEAAPADRARGVDLDDRLAHRRRIGRLARRAPLELPEVRPRALEQATAGPRGQQTERAHRLHPASSFLTISAPWTSAASFCFTTHRGVSQNPQSGLSQSFSGATCLSTARMRSATSAADSALNALTSITPAPSSLSVGKS